MVSMNTFGDFCVYCSLPNTFAFGYTKETIFVTVGVREGDLKNKIPSHIHLRNPLIDKLPQDTRIVPEEALLDSLVRIDHNIGKMRKSEKRRS